MRTLAGKGKINQTGVSEGRQHLLRHHPHRLAQPPTHLHFLHLAGRQHLCKHCGNAQLQQERRRPVTQASVSGPSWPTASPAACCNQAPPHALAAPAPPGRRWTVPCASCLPSAARSACPSGVALPPRPCRPGRGRQGRAEISHTPQSDVLGQLLPTRRRHTSSNPAPIGIPPSPTHLASGLIGSITATTPTSACCTATSTHVLPRPCATARVQPGGESTCPGAEASEQR